MKKLLFLMTLVVIFGCEPSSNKKKSTTWIEDPTSPEHFINPANPLSPISPLNPSQSILWK